MPKRVLAAGFVLMSVVLAIGNASAQFLSPPPYIAVYFDHCHTAVESAPTYPSTPTTPCPGAGVLDTLCVVLHNAAAWVGAVEFCIRYPQAIIWLGDLETQPVTLGYTPCNSSNGGISMAWPVPQNGWKPILICRSLVLWICDQCDPVYFDNRIIVDRHQLSANPYPQYTGFPAPALFNAIGLTSLICATIPAEETTWGRLKALYSD